MNKVYIHSKDNLSKIVLKFCLSLIPLIAYGIYKNGILLYQRNIIDFLDIFKILYLIILSTIAYIINLLIFKKKLHFDLDILSVIIIPLFMPPNINVFIYFVGFFLNLLIYNILNKWLKLNNIAFIKLGIMLIAFIFSTYSYPNLLERQNIYSFNFFDLLWGRNIGGIASTSIVFGFIFLIYNAICNNYKWSIAISSIVSFLVIFCFLEGFSNSAFINSSAILAFILVAPSSKSTPTNLKANIFYGLAVGIIAAFLVKYLNYYEGAMISITFVSLIYTLFAKTNKKCYNMNDFKKKLPNK